MTVGELVAKLKTLDQTAPIVVSSCINAEYDPDDYQFHTIRAIDSCYEPAPGFHVAAIYIDRKPDNPPLP